MDPLAVLAANSKAWMTRLAAHNVVLRDEREQAEKAKRK